MFSADERDRARNEPGAVLPGSPTGRQDPRYALALVTRAEQALQWCGRRPGWSCVAVALALGLPLIVALIALRGDRWYPVLDLAMTEFRVRDVGTSTTPLIGLPGRIGTYPDQGSHPGPLSFYLLAPTYRLLGSSSWALEVATLVIHIAAIGVAVWIGYRQARWRGVAVVAVLMAVVVRGYGQVPLTQPWNPYLPLVAWVVVLLALWAVLNGDHLMVVPLVVAATYCAQTHIPYLALGTGMAVVGLGAVAWTVRRGRRESPCQRGPLVSLVVAVVAGVLLWLPPLADQIWRRPGNIRQLVDHFGSPPDAPIGVREGLELALRHLDAWAGLGGQFVGTGRFIAAASAWRGLFVLLVWLAAAVIAWRIGSRALRALHAVVAVGLVLGAVSMARIFGRPWFYLTLWAWSVTALSVGAVVWTVWTVVAWWRRRQEVESTSATPAVRGGGRITTAAAAVAAVITLLTAVAFADAHHAEERLSEAVGALAGPTYDAVVDGVGAASGPDGSYIVRWSDAADIGSPGFGLLDELERRGLDVAADTYFRVPATPYRVRPRAEADAQIHLATGGYIEAWREVPDAIEVASFDARTSAQVAEYDEVRERFTARLVAEGLDDLVALVDTNLFGMSVDPRLSAADQADIGRLIELGQPMVVFVAPAPADEDPGAL